MKHFDETTIQKYLDNELSPEERNEVEKHLENCQECSKQIDNQRVFAENVKKSIEAFVPNEAEIPDCIPTEENENLKNSLNLFSFNGLRNIVGVFHHQRFQKRT